MKLKRILCLIIALVMVVLVCASCNGNGEKTDPDREGQIIVATWNKGNIWSGDVFEWVNYFYSLYYSDIQGGVRTTKDILELSIRAYCLVPLLENYLKEIGKTVSEDAVEVGVLQMMMNLDELYSEEGGFEYWKNELKSKKIIVGEMSHSDADNKMPILWQ